MELASILVLSYLMLVAVFLGMIHYQRGTVTRAVLNAFFPFVLAMAGASFVMSAISNEVVTGSLGGASVETLRGWEAGLPEQIKVAGDLSPPWALIAFAGLALVAAVAKVKVKSLIAARKLAWLVQFAAAGLGAASFFTLFGDGLEDRLGDVKSEIHVAKVRLHALKDLLVRDIAIATAREAVAMVRMNPQSALMAIREDVAKAMRHAQALRKLSAHERAVGIYVLSGAPWLREAKEKEQRAVDLLSGTPPYPWAADASVEMPRWNERLPTLGTEIGQDVVSVAEQEDVAKEFLGQAASVAKDAFLKDTTEAFLFDLLANSVAEMIKGALLRDAIRPILDRAWLALSKGEDAVTVSKDGIRAALDVNDAAKAWPYGPAQAALALDLQKSRSIVNGMLLTEARFANISELELRKSIRSTIALLGHPGSAVLLAEAEQAARKPWMPPHEPHPRGSFHDMEQELARMYDAAALDVLDALGGDSTHSSALWDVARETRLVGAKIRATEFKLRAKLEAARINAMKQEAKGARGEGRRRGR